MFLLSLCKLKWFLDNDINTSGIKHLMAVGFFFSLNHSLLTVLVVLFMVGMLFFVVVVLISKY